MDVITDVLAEKFIDIEKRILFVLNQLNDEEANWRPNDSSNSIANLIIHIVGNIKERISNGIHNKVYIRDRDQEFETTYLTILELKTLLKENFTELIETTKTIDQETLNRTQMIRNKERTNLEILFQSSTHFSEHLGQILYIAKILLDNKYATTSIPKKSNQ